MTYRVIELLLLQLLLSSPGKVCRESRRPRSPARRKCFISEINLVKALVSDTGALMVTINKIKLSLMCFDLHC